MVAGAAKVAAGNSGRTLTFAGGWDAGLARWAGLRRTALATAVLARVDRRACVVVVARRAIRSVLRNAVARRRIADVDLARVGAGRAGLLWAALADTILTRVQGTQVVVAVARRPVLLELVLGTSR